MISELEWGYYYICSKCMDAWTHFSQRHSVSTDHWLKNIKRVQAELGYSAVNGAEMEMAVFTQWYRWCHWHHPKHQTSLVFCWSQPDDDAEEGGIVILAAFKSLGQKSFRNSKMVQGTHHNLIDLGSCPSPSLENDGQKQDIECDHVYALDLLPTWLLAVAMQVSDESDPISTGCNCLAAFLRSIWGIDLLLNLPDRPDWLKGGMPEGQRGLCQVARGLMDSDQGLQSQSRSPHVNRRHSPLRHVPPEGVKLFRLPRLTGDLKDMTLLATTSWAGAHIIDPLHTKSSSVSW